MKKHLGHVAMCAPMFLVASLLIAGGAGFGVVIPLVACVLMMALMMRSMDDGDHGGQSKRDLR